MGSNINFQNEYQDESNMNPLLITAESGFNNKFSQLLKRVIYVSSLAVIVFIFNGCAAGYIASEPDYQQYDRPMRPNNVSIWIDGDWGWNNQSHQYYQRNGYWDNPRHGQTRVSGHWQSTPKGKTWSKGYWQSEGRRKHNKNR
jgi:hypothetical protein